MASLPAARVVVLYGNVAEATLQQHLESVYCVYAVGRAMQRTSGANGLLDTDLIEEVRRLDLFRNAGHVRKLLHAGSGVFWTIKAGRVWLHGMAAIGWRLGCRGANGHRYRISTDQLRTREGRRAQLLSATLPVGAPIRQSAVHRLTGVSARTQRRYRMRGHFGARRQDARVSGVFDAETPALRRAAAFEWRGHGVYIAGPDQLLRKRLPNVYVTAGERIPRGRRSKEMFAGRPLIAVAEGALTVPRVFFETVPQWVRCRRLKLGTAKAEPVAYPFNWSYARAGVLWEAVA